MRKLMMTTAIVVMALSVPAFAGECKFSGVGGAYVSFDVASGAKFAPEAIESGKIKWSGRGPVAACSVRHDDMSMSLSCPQAVGGELASFNFFSSKPGTGKSDILIMDGLSAWYRDPSCK